MKLGKGKMEDYTETFQDKASHQYVFAWWGTSPCSSCTGKAMLHSPLNDGTENNSRGK